MFGMGFMEIMIIAVIAVIFLGPDKLPETLVNIAKFFRSMKSTVADAKDSIEQEMNITELKQEALSYKEDLMAASNELERVTSMASINDEIADIDASIHNESPVKKSDDDTQEPEQEKVTFEKKTNRNNIAPMQKSDMAALKPAEEETTDKKDNA